MISLRYAEAGIWAPSGMASQSPIVVAVTDDETHQRLVKAIRNVLGFPGNSEGIGHCCIGYPDQEGNAAERKPGRVFWA